LAKPSRWTADRIEERLKWGDANSARMARIARNLLFCTAAVVAAGTGIYGLATGKAGTQLPPGVRIDVGSMSSVDKSSCANTAVDQKQSVQRGARK